MELCWKKLIDRIFIVMKKIQATIENFTVELFL